VNKTLVTLLVTFALVSFATLSAQEAAQEATQAARHPGDVVKLDIRLDGPDAAKVTSVNVDLRMHGTLQPNQPKFETDLRAAGVKLAAANAFAVDIPIPQNAATGDYLLEVYAIAADNAGMVTYQTGQDFQLHPIRVENPRTFTAPKITVKERH
jgi:phosphate-selective porin